MNSRGGKIRLLRRCLHRCVGIAETRAEGDNGVTVLGGDNILHLAEPHITGSLTVEAEVRAVAVKDSDGGDDISCESVLGCPFASGSLV
jgi:hypothetical protein